MCRSLPTGLATHSAAQADRYVEVGGLPARAAEGLRVPAAWRESSEASQMGGRNV